MSKNKKIILYTSLGAVSLFFIWWIIAAIINSTLFPTPIKVIPIMFQFLGKGSTYLSIGGTFLRLLISFVISFILGMILGILAGYFYRLEAFLKPIIGFFRTLPTAAVVLILIVFLKPSFTPVIVTCLVMFPLFYQSFLDGIKNMDKNVKDDLSIEGANPFNSFFKVYVPTISPYILLAVVQSFGLGMKVSIMAEILGGSNQISGLGRAIHAEYIEANAANVIALSLIAILIIGIIDIILMVVKKSVNKDPKHGKRKNRTTKELD